MADFKVASRQKPSRRWIKPYHWAVASTSQTFVVGRVFLLEFEMTDDGFIDALSWVNGATLAGTIRTGIYGPVVTEETCAGAPLVSGTDTGDITQAGVSSPQQVTFTPVFLRKGRYYIALESSDVTATYIRQTNGSQVVGWVQFYDRGGGYGALTNPCPAVTNTGSAAPTMSARISS